MFSERRLVKSSAPRACRSGTDGAGGRLSFWANALRLLLDHQTLVERAGSGGDVHHVHAVGQSLPDLAEDCDNEQQYLVDSAYGTPDNHEAMRELEISLQAVEQARRNKPLTEHQRLWNKLHSRVRARVEQVFGHMTMCIKGLNIRGLDRAHAQMTMASLTYNFQRVIYLNRNAKGNV